MRKRFLLLTLGGLLTSLLVFLPRSLSDAPPQDSEFVYARIRYHMTPNAFFMREAPWHHDYPYGDETLPTILAEVTRVKTRSEEHTSELQSHSDLVCRLLLEKKKKRQ